MAHVRQTRRSLLVSGLLFGIGFVAFVDEAVFHQVLGWHHFYDRSTTEIGLLSDGVFHAFSWFATVGGAFLLADTVRRGGWSPLRWWAAVLVGVGAFQLYDGIVQHKLLRVHQIRSVDDLLPYDLAWNVSAALVLAVGAVLLFVDRRRAATVRS